VAEEQVIVGTTELREDDFRQAWHAVPAFKRLKFMVLVLPGVWVMHPLVVWMDGGALPTPSKVWPTLALMLVILSLFSFVVVTSPRRWARQALADLGSGPVTFRFDARGMQVTSALREHRVAWEALPQHVESRDSFVIYTGAHTVLVMPKRALDGQGLSDLRARLRRRIPPKTGQNQAYQRLVIGLVLVTLTWSLWRFFERSSPH
jgi:hypothetical protein